MTAALTSDVRQISALLQYIRECLYDGPEVDLCTKSADALGRLARSSEGLSALEALLASSPDNIALLCDALNEIDDATDLDEDAPLTEEVLYAALGGREQILAHDDARTESHMALANHLHDGNPPEQMEPGWCFTCIGPLIGSPGTIALDIKFPHRIGDILWDRLLVPAKYPHIQSALLVLEIWRPEDLIGPIEPARHRPLPPLYRYHAHRFEHHTRIVTGPTRTTQDVQAVGMEDFQHMVQAVGAAMNQGNEHIPLRERLKYPPVGAKEITQVVQMAMAVQGFRRAGSQLFDLPPSLVEMLAHTDVDQVPLSLLKVPYACIYLHFGRQAGLELKAGFAVDGAYVSRAAHGGLTIQVTTAAATPEASERWAYDPEPSFTQDYPGSLIGYSVGEAVDSVLSDTIASLMAARSQPPPELPPEMAALANENGVSKVTWVGNETAQQKLDALPAEAEVYRNTLRLVVNGLAYITTYPDDVRTEWVSGSPASMVAKASRPGKEGERAKSKLEAMGYRLVHLCGQDIVKQRGAARSERGVSTHWVRGHWRNQAHGPGRTLRKMIWVMPYLVSGASEGDEQPLGHLYLVS